MQSPLPNRICCREIDDAHLSLFATAEFHVLVKELTRKNSLASLFSFIVSTHGVSAVSREHPYIFILYENLKPTHKTYNMLSHAKSGHYIKTWGTEIFTRILAKIPLTAERATTTKLPLIAAHLADKLYANYRLNKVCPIYDSRFIAYARDTIARELGCHNTQYNIDAPTIAQVGNEIVSDMQKYFAQKRRRKYCTLLTFFGADFDTRPAITSSAALQEVLLSSKVVEHVANGNMSPAEASCRNGIFTALSTTITEITHRLEEEEIFVSKVFAWYRVVKKLQQLICEYITIPTLNRSLHIVKQLDASYRKSICFGDCTDFFESFKDIKNHFSSGNDQYIQRLFSALSTTQSTYTIMSHSELAAEIRDCNTGHTTLRVAPVCTSLTAKLQKTGYKISAGAASLRNTTIFETNAFLRNIKKKLCKSKADAQKRLGTTHKHYGSTTSIHLSQKFESPEDGGYDNDNQAVFTSYHRRKTISWRRHLLRKVGKYLGIKHSKRHALTKIKSIHQDTNSACIMAAAPANETNRKHSTTGQAEFTAPDNNPFTAAEDMGPIVSNLTSPGNKKSRQRLCISFGKAGKKLRHGDTKISDKNTTFPGAEGLN